MEEYIFAIDIGTTSVKAIVLSSGRRIVAQTTIEHNLISRHPNWAEEDGDIWWDHTKQAIHTLVAEHPEFLPSLKGIGISGMVPAIVLLDENGKVLRKTIQQNDARAINQIAKLEAELDQDDLFARTGGRTNQQHILPRLLWVKENEPEVWEHVHWIMGSYDYIAYRLTGVPTLEINWAVESGAFDIRKQEWLKDQLLHYGVQPAHLPPVHASMEIIGTVQKDICLELGLPGEIPVIAGSADHVASTLAAGIIAPGDLLIKFGGAGDILFCTDKIQTNEKLFFDYHIIPNRYLLNGCMAASGSLVKWFVKDMINAINEPDIYKKLDDEAEQVAPAADGLIILPYFLGEKTPIFDPTARGVLFGLTLSHTRGHIFRAILEAVIYGFRHHLDVLSQMGYTPNRIFATNGGAKSKFWCQIAADVLGQEVTSFPHHPGSSLGVGFLAGLATNVFSDWNQIYDFLEERHTYHPVQEHCAIYDKAYGVYRAVYEQTKPSLAAIQEFYR